MERGFLGRWRAEALGELPENADILELGAGTGANFKYYPPSHLAVSSELSGEMLAVAQTKARENFLVQADAQLLPFPTNSFDAVFATLVFCSIPDPMQAFAEVRRVVRPGGRVVLMEHVTKKGDPKLVRSCSLPLTGRRVVSRVITDLGVLDVAGAEFLLRELAPGVSVDEVRDRTDAPVVEP